MSKAEQSLEYLRTSRGMPWIELGMKVFIDGKPAVVVGGNDSLVIRYDGENTKRRAHPFWRTQYFNKDGKLIAVDGKPVSS